MERDFVEAPSLERWTGLVAMHDANATAVLPGVPRDSKLFPELQAMRNLSARWLGPVCEAPLRLRPELLGDVLLTCLGMPCTESHFLRPLLEYNFLKK